MSSSSSSSNSSSTSSNSGYDNEIADRYIVRDDTENKILRNDESTNKIIRAPLLFTPTLTYIGDAYNELSLYNWIYVHKYGGAQKSTLSEARSTALTNYNNSNWDNPTGIYGCNIYTDKWVGSWVVTYIAERIVIKLSNVNSPYRGEDIQDLIIQFRLMAKIGTQNPTFNIRAGTHNSFPTSTDNLPEAFTQKSIAGYSVNDNFFVPIRINASYHTYLSIYYYWDDYSMSMSSTDDERYAVSITNIIKERWKN